MKKIIITMLVVFVVWAGVVHAAIYNIGPGDNFGNLTLVDYDTLLMTGGEGHNLGLYDWSLATIDDTDPLNIGQGDGGIWKVDASSYSVFNFNDGEINSIETYGDSTVNMRGGDLTTLEMHSESQAYLEGGTIENMASDQTLDGDMPWHNAMIHIFCLDYLYDSPSNLLTGHWGDSSTFSMNLIDIGTIPTYDYIEFHIIPEPATLFIFALGGLLLWRRETILLRIKL